MSENSGWCRILVRNADDPEVAAEALGRFRDDLWTSDLFAPLDGEFGNDVDGTPLRYTPASATEVQLGAEGPEFSFDAQDILVTWPELVDDLIRQLRERLRGAGVRRAEIGKPRRPYSERAYVAEADWFHGSGQYLEPLHAKWLPSRFPDRFPIPVNSRVVVAHQAHDGSWTHVAWRRGRVNDDFSDVQARWHRDGVVVEPMTAPPQAPPDISWDGSMSTVRLHLMDPLAMAGRGSSFRGRSQRRIFTSCGSHD